MNAYLEPTPVAARQQRILIVEDEFIIADRLRTILEKLDYANVGMVHSVATALTVLRETPFDLVLLDINLKEDRDGISLAREIRLRYGLPFVYITAYVDEKTMAQAEASHPYGYVVKPFKPTDIQAAVQLAYYRQAYEQISRQEQERRLLLDVSTAIATIRDKEDLFRIITGQLKPLLAFEEAYVAVPLPVGNTYRVLMAEATQPCRSADQSCTVTDQTWAHIPAYKHVVASGRPVLFKPEQTAAGSVQTDQNVPLSSHSQTLFSLGIPLRYASNVLGGLFLLAPENVFDEQKYSFYQVIADQVAVAVANILANEEILEQKQEKELLLRVAQAIATVQNKEDLLHTIFELVQPVFAFDDLGLAVLEPDQQHVVDWVVQMPWLSDSEVNAVLHEQQQARMPYPGTLMEHIYKEVEAQGHPLIIPLTQDLADQWPNAVYLPVEIEHTQKESLFTILKVRGRLLGSFNLNSKREGYYATTDIHLFQAIADQVAVAVANILANEEILEREREKTQLLKVSEAISTIRDAHSLFSSLSDIIRSIIAFDDAPMIFLLDEQRQHYRIFYSKIFDPSANLSALGEWQQGKKLIATDPIATYLIGQNRTLVLNVKQALEQWGDFPGKQTMLELALQECLVAPLRVKDSLSGFLCVWSRSEAKFGILKLNLFQAIADQVAVAVANILANEEILEREREKAMLLSISEQLATIRNKEELLALTLERLKPVFGFEEAVLSLYDQDSEYVQHYNLDQENKPKGPYYRQVVSQKLSLQDSPHQEFRTYQGPEVIDIAYFQQAYPGHPGVKVMEELGLVQSCIMPLRYRNRLLGMLEFHAVENNQLGRHHLSLYRNLSDQVAVALANILANEEILAQKAEIEGREREKSLQIAITETLVKEGSWEAKLAAVAGELGRAIPFHHIYFSISAPAGHRGYGFVQDEAQTYTYMSHGDFMQATGLSQKEFTSLQGQSVGYYTKPGYYTGEAFDTLCKTYGLERAVHRLFGHQSSLNVPFACENGLLISISMGALEADAYTPAHLALLARLMPAITLALEKLLAYEDIQQREKEKTLQISVNTVLGQEGTWQEKFGEIARLLEEMIPWDVVSFNLDFIGRGLSYVKRQDDTAFLSLEDFMADTGLSAEEVYALRASSTGHYNTTGIYTGEAYEQSCRNYPFKQLASQTYGLRSSLNVVAPIGTGQHIVITFASRRPDGYRPEQLDLLERIVPPLSLAVQKLLANEEILEREREKSLQVAVIHALTQEGSWEEKFLRLTRVLQMHIPFDYLYLLLEKDKQYGRGHAYRRIGFDEYQSIDTESFFRMTGINQQKYLAMREQRVYAGPELLAGEAFEKAAGKYALLGLLARTFDLQSNVAIPLKLSYQGRFVLNVLSKKPQGLTPEHLALLEKISAPLALTLENLLAYEEIKGLKERLEVEKEYLEDEINVNYKFEDIIGASQSLKEVFKKVSLVATADSTVLVLGETGTGKELVARAIHNLSKRSDRALVKINCAALPAQLIESELFGHERGAFTGAVDRRIGKFELAHGSTIFLDEVGELPLELQAKLLRAIQEKEVERLGGNKVVKTDIRIIAATNRNLEKEVAQGRFRADLYFRLNVFPLTLPPLRDRKEDIPLLAVHFIRKMGKKLGKNITGISNAAIKEMQAYNWPGNIRELEHIIERAAITSTGIISELGLPEKDSDVVAFPVGGHVQQTLAQNERALIMETLKRCDGRIRGKGGAAELLDIEANTLDARMKKLGIVRKQTFGSGV